MSDDIKAAAERYAKHGKATTFRDSPYFIADEKRMAVDRLYEDRALLADAYLALGERQEDRWTHQRASDGALSMYTFETPQAAANFFHAEKDGRIVRVSTFIREEGEGEGA